MFGRYICTSLQQLPYLLLEKQISYLSSHSKDIIHNTAFFALGGLKYTTEYCINDAINSGAKIIITDNINVNRKGNIITVNNVYDALYYCTYIFYSAEPQHIIPITGTNGKTSVAYYLQQILSIFNIKAASIGTLGMITSSNMTGLYNSTLTTPDFLLLRKTLHQLAHNNISYVALEASSHAISQNRLYGIKSAVSAFISFAADHLDYHKTINRYLYNKLKLFTDYTISKSTIVISETVLPLITYRIKEQHQIITIGNAGNIRFNILCQDISGQNVQVLCESKKFFFETNIIGHYQIENMIIAATIVHQLKVASWYDIISILNKITPPPGRLERIIKNIFVDYAHNEHGLQTSLLTLQKVKTSNQKLCVVFGCGGNRDSKKRERMGRVADKIADIVIITDDNPRNESPQAIRKQILIGCSRAIEIANRHQAIVYAIRHMSDNDILLIAGKGHEEYQIIDDVQFYFSDKTAILSYV